MADTDSNPIEPRVARLEATVEAILREIRDIREDIRELRTDIRDLRREVARDFRWLLALYLAGTGALLGVMAHGFHWV